MMKPRLVLCSGATAPRNTPFEVSPKIVRLDTLGPDPNTHLLIENVTDAFLKHLSPRLVDLLEIAAYVYTADCEASRELAWAHDRSVEPWGRKFHFVMPVRDLDFWSQSDVRQSLVSALSFLSSDEFEFTFCAPTKERPLQEYLQIEQLETKPFHGVDRVTMFSGGLDSLAGAVESAARGDKLVLVSHRPAVQINRRQLALADRLRRMFSAQMMHIPIWVNKSGMDGESSQRTRSFLFSALGVAVATVLKADGVRFYENGVTSLNWRVADEVLRSRASRTTHPMALRNMQCFYRLVTGNEKFVVDNPFIFKTKAEVVSVIGDKGARDLIQHSCSCPHTMFQSKTQWHCGRCGQCIDRRIAMLASGLDEYDPWEDYIADVFTGPRPLNPKRPYDHNIAVNYARLARELDRMSVDEIGSAYNAELARAVRFFPDKGAAARQFIDMHKRHAATVCKVLGQQMKVHSEDFVAGNLEKTSLLGMIGGLEHLGPSSMDHDMPKEPRPSPSDDDVFRASDDYRIIWLNGKQMPPLSKMQAEIISILDEARKAGQSAVPHATILSRMESPPARLSDAFRGSDPRKRLIKRIGKDTYSLDI